MTRSVSMMSTICDPVNHPRRGAPVPVGLTRCDNHGMDIGEIIQQWRNSRGYTQGHLAKLCGWASPSRIGMYERGGREPSFSDAEVIARVFHVSLSRFLLGPDYEPDEPPHPADTGEQAPDDLSEDDWELPHDLIGITADDLPVAVSGPMTRDPDSPRGWRWEHEEVLVDGVGWDRAALENYHVVMHSEDIHKTTQDASANYDEKRVYLGPSYSLVVDTRLRTPVRGARYVVLEVGRHAHIFSVWGSPGRDYQKLQRVDPKRPVGDDPLKDFLTRARSTTSVVDGPYPRRHVSHGPGAQEPLRYAVPTSHFTEHVIGVVVRRSVNLGERISYPEEQKDLFNS